MVRPSKGLGHVDAMEGDLQAKQRLCVILSTLPKIHELMRVDEACRVLHIGPTYFAEMRERALQASLNELGPRPIGRPRRMATISVEEVEALQRRVQELEHEVVILNARLELAALPAPRETQRSKSHRPPALGRRPGPAAAVRRAVP